MANINVLMEKEKGDKTPMSGAGATLPFWQAPMNSTSVIRILPNGDGQGQPDANKLPWVEVRKHKLVFDGVVGAGEDDTTAETIVTCTCPQTFGLRCPIEDHISPLWRGSEDDKALARRFYRRPTYIISALAVSLPFTEREVPANPVRLVHLNKSLFENLHAGLMNSDFGEFGPWDFIHGRDFKITKTQQGQWANYATSAFAYKERPLSEVELEGIVKYGLSDLNELVGEKPDDEYLRLLPDLYRDSMNGQPFDNQKYGHRFRFFASRQPSAVMLGGAPRAQASVSVSAQASAAPGGRPQQAQAILEAIRERNTTTRFAS